MNSNVSDHALESLCSQFVSTVSRAIGGADPDARQPVALLDVPGHANVGDQLIYLGQLALLEAAGLDISFQCRAGQRIEQNLSRLHPEGPLLMQGGGNLGDLWPAFQLWRERVISEFHDRKIVLLPQSIQFESTSNAQRARRGFAEHPDLTLLLRDYSSLERAKTCFRRPSRSIAQTGRSGQQRALFNRDLLKSTPLFCSAAIKSLAEVGGSKVRLVKQPTIGRGTPPPQGRLSGSAGATTASSIELLGRFHIFWRGAAQRPTGWAHRRLLPLGRSF